MRPHFEAPDSEFRARVEASFQRQPAMKTMGIALLEVGAGWVEMSFQRTEGLTQQHGFAHAGVVATALDSACGYAAFSLMPSEAAVLTAEYKINLLRPADADQYIVAGWVIKPGRTLTVAQGATYPTGSEDPIAIMTATVARVEGRDLAG